MNLFRIAKEKYIHELTGEGARLFGGRWNQKGVAVLYTSPTVSLAAIEVLVNTPLAAMPDDLQLMVLSVPETIRSEQVKKKKLPENWRSYPPPDMLIEMGTKWITSNSSLLLKVPSAVIPMEWNVLINPNHPDFEKVKKKEVYDFSFDKRLTR
ncbi:MAG: RES family NAD+ phosphorylase [Balneolaceae bacterium]